MTLLRTTLLSSLLATVVLGASAAPRTEVIPLNYRTADDVMAVAQSVIGSEGKVTAYGNQLIVNAEPAKIRELQSVLQQIDSRPHRLLITVDTSENLQQDSRGYSVEYFVEGGRSRTGRLLDPKTGTLSMTIQAMLRGGNRPITLVPIYIGYEHVMEVGTYAKELRGATKEKESLPQMVRGLSKLRNLGQGYVNFGEPLPLMTYLNQHVPDWREAIDPIEAVRPSWLTPTVNSIAADLMVRINNAGAANAMNLCCTALLASRQRSLTREQLTQQLECYLALLRNVPYSPDATAPSASASELIDHALQMNKFEVEIGRASCRERV